MEEVLPSIESPALKLFHKSGIEYPAKSHIARAAKPSLILGENTVIRLRQSLNHQSDTPTVPDLKTHPIQGQATLRIHPEASPYLEQQIKPTDKIAFGSMPRVNSMKREHIKDHDPSTPNKPIHILPLLSPPTFNTNLRSYQLEKYGVVELPKAVVELETARRKLAAQEDRIREQERLEKGKFAERYRPADPLSDGLERPANKISEAKKQHSASKTASWYPQSKLHALNPRIKVEKYMRDERDTPRFAGQPTLYDNGSKRPPRKWNIQGPSPSCKSKESRQQIPRRREVSQRSKVIDKHYPHRKHVSDVKTLAPRLKDCTCDMLPEFFIKNWHFIPEDAWPGGRLEFLEHLRQISSCHGHPVAVRNYCQRVLKVQNYPGSSDPSPAVEPTQRQSALRLGPSAIDPIHHLSNPHNYQGFQKESEDTSSKHQPEPSASCPSRLTTAGRKRCKSMPTLSALGAFTTAEIEPGSSVEQSQRSPVQRPPAAVMVSGDMLMGLTQRVEKIENSLLPVSPVNNHNNSSGTAQASIAANITSVSSQPPRKKRKTVAEEKATDKPEYDRNVPEHLCQSEETLIQIGRIISGYERHKRAPEAFAWKGRLRSKFNQLLTKRDEHGNLVWDHIIIPRLKW